MVARLGLAVMLAGLGLLPWRQTAPAPAPAGTLHFTATWRLLPAGEATMAWSDAGPGLRAIQFTADASRLVALFYPLQDRMRSVYDTASFCTTAVDNDTLEGRRHRQTHIRYQRDLGQLTLDETDLVRSPPVAKHEVKPVPGCVLDLLSALDYVRAQPLHVGDVYHFPVNEGGATGEVQLTVDLRETIATPAGRFSAVRAHPVVLDPGVLARPGKMWIWFSDDARHLPVQIESKVSWGTLIAQLSP